MTVAIDTQGAPETPGIRPVSAAQSGETAAFDYEQNYRAAFQIQASKLATDTGSYAMATVSTGGAVQTPGLTLPALYPQSIERTQILHRALSLFNEFISHLYEGHDSATNNGDAIAADICCQQAFAMLPDLFAYRHLGDGFGSFIAAVHTAYVNKAGGLFSPDEINAVIEGSELLASEPYMSQDRAVDEIIKLEDAGLEVDSKYLGEILNDVGEK
jgi:hypothetical protein